MSFSVENVVPWGRSYDEYVAMFDLSKVDLESRILGCGDGPASFNALLTKQGGQVLSVDPLYRHSTDEVRKRIGETYDDVMGQVRKNKDEFIWTTIKSVEQLGTMRMAAMEEFLSDYQRGAQEGRYLYGELPHLQAVIDNMSAMGYCVTIDPVSYEFQRDGNKMMKIRK